MAKTKRRSRRNQKTLFLDSSFYPFQAISKAREAFLSFAEISLEKREHGVQVHFYLVDNLKLETLIDEFANYALSCMVYNR
jgi:hypothetical protein